MTRILPLVAILLSAALHGQVPQLLFQEGFEGGLSSGWIWEGPAPTLVSGCVGTQALAKPLTDAWTSNDVRPDWLFHPLPYDTLLQYQVRARAWIDQGDWSDPRTVFIGFGWYQAGAADPFGNIAYAYTQQESCPFQDLWSSMFPMPQGAPGAVFGLVVHAWRDFPTEMFLDDVKVYTLPYKAKFNGSMFLEGPYDPDTQLMSDDLRAQGLLPLTEPYTALGFAQVANGGGETTTQAVLDSTYPGGRVVDWVHLELRHQLDNTQVVATVNALLLQNGTVISADPTQSVLFGVRPGVYWIGVRHRNHLGCMSASTRTLPYTGGGGTWTHDFTQAYPTFGTNAVKVVEGRNVLWAGNAVVDDRLKYTGAQNDRDAILQAIGGTVPTATITGYHVEDVTMDGMVKYAGANNDRDPILENIGGTVPSNVRVEQFPWSFRREAYMACTSTIAGDWNGSVREEAFPVFIRVGFVQ